MVAPSLASQGIASSPSLGGCRAAKLEASCTAPRPLAESLGTKWRLIFKVLLRSTIAVLGPLCINALGDLTKAEATGTGVAIW
jgi:hypothetical protein